MLVPRLVGSVARGKPIHLQGENGIRLNPIHVSDAVRKWLLKCQFSAVAQTIQDVLRQWLTRPHGDLVEGGCRGRSFVA